MWIVGVDGRGGHVCVNGLFVVLRRADEKPKPKVGTKRAKLLSDSEPPTTPGLASSYYC